MSNFDFLREHYPAVFQKMKIAESRIYTESKSAAHYSRLALEEVVHHIYKEEHIPLPYDTGLANLMREEEFREAVPSEFSEALYIIRKTGNAGAHYGTTVASKDALICVKYLYTFLKWFANIYAEEQPTLPAAFDPTCIPKIGQSSRDTKKVIQEAQKVQDQLQSQIEALKGQLYQERERAQQSEEAFVQYKLEQKARKAELEQQKKNREKRIASEFTESETRTHLIDLDLREAGWDCLQEGRELEYPVTGMPITNDNPRGNGFCDYVLWDDNGLPLAVIEAKRTSNEPERGRHQAHLYANCLESMHGQRPIIFYTNGYNTFIWDDVFYSLPRRIYGFYNKQELQWAIQKRQTRQDIRNAQIDLNISGRPYQIEGIQRMAETFVTDGSESGTIRGAKRHALLVMATGSGKTRVSASIVDVLFRNNWIKRALFLADRNALVTQAKDAFAEHLPHISSIDLTKEKENNTTRLVFSTYQSIINRIDNERNGDERFYGVGHFDLIIVDEAHRSVYNKYGVIFEYFDSLLLGLTATPKKDIDYNTFELFECSDGNPTFVYELEDAVKNGFLVPYKNINVSTNFLREGIKYKELSQSEKEKYEEEFRDNATGLFPEHIRNSALNRWLFNKDTVFKILDEFMTKGLKIENGDKIGRTIIFAFNQKHADFILNCFEERYPYLPSGFMSVIHNQKSHSEDLIKKFSHHHKENHPQIAVSVDMMDTGIDAPRVLNLVFFKVIRSYSKFWQMIGRGTRLCPDVFGPGMAKEYFLIFDVCGNFDFFEENPFGTETPISQPITQQIFLTRLAVARLLLETAEDEDRRLSHGMIDMLQSSIKALDINRFDVKMKRQFVDEFSNRERWTRLDPESIHAIEYNLSHLPIPESINEKARRFDLMMLKMMQASLLLKESVKGYEENVLEIADQLSKKYSIPQVLRSKALIERLRDPEFYKELSKRKMEEIRIEIRELVQYLEEGDRPIIKTNFEDKLITEPGQKYAAPETNELYKRRVERFVRENKDHLTISKLNTNKQITKGEIQELERILFDGGDRGTLEKYKEVYGEQPLGKFIRSIVGLDISAAQEAFGEFITSANLNADQMKFIDTIIQHLNRNGTIEKSLLFEPPFTDAHDEGLIGIFDEPQVVKIIHLINGINENVEATN